jgi:hypothetical protein
VTPGQAHDATGYDDLMDDGAPDPETMIGDKGYDSEMPSATISKSAAPNR